MCIVKNLEKIRARIRASAEAAGRDPSRITLLVASKGQSIEKLRATISAGCRDFGENQVQAAIQKMAALQGLKLTWHFIGTIQTNKTRLIAQHFDWVHSLTSVKHAIRLNDQRAERQALNVCLEVNISREATKTGLPPEALESLCATISELPRLRLRGLMCIPRPGESQAAFQQMQTLFHTLQKTYASVDTLSMGMSEDYRMAIQQGATLVRIGSAIFGPRKKTDVCAANQA